MFIAKFVAAFVTILPAAPLTYLSLVASYLIVISAVLTPAAGTLTKFTGTVISSPDFPAPEATLTVNPVGAVVGATVGATVGAVVGGATIAFRDTDPAFTAAEMLERSLSPNVEPVTFTVVAVISEVKTLKVTLTNTPFVLINPFDIV